MLDLISKISGSIYDITNLIELSSRAANAWEAISVLANSSVGRKRIRATSRATFP